MLSSKATGFKYIVSALFYKRNLAENTAHPFPAQLLRNIYCIIILITVVNTYIYNLDCTEPAMLASQYML